MNSNVNSPSPVYVAVTPTVWWSDAYCFSPQDSERKRRAEQHALAAASPRALAEVYIRLGRIFRLREDPNGVTFFEKALELCRRHAYPLLEAAACIEYASFRTALGDVDEARAYEQRAHELSAQHGTSPAT